MSMESGRPRVCALDGSGAVFRSCLCGAGLLLSFLSLLPQHNCYRSFQDRCVKASVSVKISSYQK